MAAPRAAFVLSSRRITEPRAVARRAWKCTADLRDRPGTGSCAGHRYREAKRRREKAKGPARFLAGPLASLQNYFLRAVLRALFFVVFLAARFTDFFATFFAARFFRTGILSPP
jgi:hypothetical protein